MTIPITGFDHLAMTVSDVDRASAFYIAVLGGEQISEYAPAGAPLIRGVRCGAVKLNLHQYGNGIDLVAGKPTPGSVDVCFRWSGPIETAQAHLARHGIAIVDGPSKRVSNDGQPATSVYFRDLDGNLLELLTVD
jgi:catechol 2,3-dioxygenase-like lactoylglutathione lyase family enzyme